MNFVDLHSFVEGPKFWKTFPLKQGQMPEMLLHPKSYLQYNTTNLNTENKYFCNIVMVGHFTFGLCWDGMGMGVTMAQYCITACSEKCSLASNLHAQQQGIAFQ